MIFHSHPRLDVLRPRQNAPIVFCPPVCSEICAVLAFLLRHAYSSSSCLIGQSFAFDAFQEDFCPVLIFDAKGLAVAIPEIEFGEVAVQVIMATVLINTFHPSLEDREESLDG